MRMVVLLFVSCVLLACDSRTGLKPFESDGCSLFPDSDEIAHVDWCSCCFEHDMAYWRGGTEAERLAADEALKQCVMNKTTNSALANVVYDGVRFGGSPYFYTWYRWGYGWKYDRKYQTLTLAEEKEADRLLNEALLSGKGLACTD